MPEKNGWINEADVAPLGSTVTRVIQTHPQEALAKAFAAARQSRSVKGFAVGRTIFGDAARNWFTGRLSDEAAVDDMAQRFGALVEIWESAG